MSNLVITGVVDGPLPGGLPKAIELLALADVADLSIYGVGSPNNGAPGGTQEITLSGSASAGQYLYVSDDVAGFTAFFGFAPDFTGSVASINGDDAIELFENGVVVDVFGEVGTDGTGEPWEYTDGWAARVADTGPDGATFQLANWTFSGRDALDGETTNAAAATPFPVGGSGDGSTGGSNGAETVLISEIQGDGAASPIEGQMVTVQAVVTAVFASDLSGFFLQEEEGDDDGDPATSEGVFVFAPSFAGDVSEGDLVSVTGTVGEFFDATQIGSVSELSVLDEGQLDQVAPAEISLPLPEEVMSREEFYEPVEGMLVTFTTPLAVTQLFNYERFGRVELSPNDRVFQYTQTNAPDADGFAEFQLRDDLNRVILDDGSDDQNPDTLPFLDVDEFGGGDLVEELTGVVSYRFGEYQILETEGAPVAFENATPRPEEPEDVGGRLKVASFNVLNYFTTLDLPENAGAVSGQDPRGAHSAAEFEIQASKIVAAIDALGADVVGLIEIENSDLALGDLVDRLNAVSDRTYDFVETGDGGVVGTDAIKVAMIYDIDTVKITEGTAPAVLDTEDFVGPVSTVLDPNDLLPFDPKNRPALATTFTELSTGESLTVAVNHLKSKGSEVAGEDVGGEIEINGESVLFDPLSGDDLGTIDGEQPIVGIVDGQGSGSATRQAAADQLVDWLAEHPTGTTDGDILIIGDLNAYAAEPAIAEIEDGPDDAQGTGDDYTNLIEAYVGDEAYSFRFSGQWGYLDHALANASLEGQVTGVTEWRVNADEPAYLDYNDNVLDPNERSFEQKPDALFAAVDATAPARSSDHDPVIVGLNLRSDPVPETYTLEILHMADQEGNADSLVDAPNASAVMNALEAQDLGDDGLADNTLRLSSGDAIIPGLFFIASEEAFGGQGRADILIQNALGFEAITLGNHEFDLGTEFLAGLISGDSEDGFIGADFTYLSANLDFSTDANLAPLVVESGQAPVSNALSGSVVVERGGEQIGIIGSTTPNLGNISSPGDVTLNPFEFTSNSFTEDQLIALAAELQQEVDALEAQGINKIILMAHYQALTNEINLAQYLSGVDVIIGGGSDSILVDHDDVLREGNDEDDVFGPYPIFQRGADGKPVKIVNTDGQYTYVGRLVLDFDENGVIIPSSYDKTVSGAYATDAAGVARLGAEGLIDPEIQAIVDELAPVVEALEQQPVGFTEVFLDGRRESVRTEETNMGNLTADANLAYVREIDETVMVSFKNGGGIRNPIGDDVTETAPDGGVVTVADHFNVLQFNNDLVLLTLTFDQLAQVLEHAVAETAPGETPGRFPQIAGVSFSFDAELEPGARLLSAALTDDEGTPIAPVIVDGEVVTPDQEVRIVTLGFLADGGDGFPFPEFGDLDRVDLDSGQGIRTGAATFADDGTEQDALAEFLIANFGTPDTAFDLAETPPELDARIQNLAFREDTVLTGLDLAMAETVEGTEGRDRLFGSDEDEVFVTNGGNSDAVVSRGGHDEIIFTDIVGQRDVVALWDFDVENDTLDLQGREILDAITIDADRTPAFEDITILVLEGGDRVWLMGYDENPFA